MIRLVALILAACAAATGAITNMRVIGTTPTQAAIAYTAPNQSVCTAQVSESSTLLPAVPDMDASLFAGADRDDRLGNISSGLSRVFVVGKRAAEKATDGRYHSRALQAYTTHYFRITCGADTTDGTFMTANIAAGNTHPEVYPVDPNAPGEYAWPTMNQAAGPGESHVDPLTGALVRRITGAGTVVDTPYSNVPNLGGFDDSGFSNHWTTTGNSLPATFAADGTTNPKLYVPADMTGATGFTPIITNDPTTHLNYTIANITAKTSANGEDAKLLACLTVDGLTCAAGTPNLVETDFSGCSGGCTRTAGGTTSYLADWFGGRTPPFNTQDVAKRANTVAAYDNVSGALSWTSGYYFGRKWTAGTRVWIGGLPYKTTAVGGPKNITIQSGLGLSNPTVISQVFGVLLWKKTTTGASVTVSNVTFTLGKTNGYTFWNSGYARQCNATAIALGGEWGFYCQLYNAGFGWMGSVTGNVLHLGSNWIAAQSADSHGNGWGRSATVNGTNFTYDPFHPASYFAVILDRNNKNILIRANYTGNNQDIASHNVSTAVFNGTVENLSPTNPNDAPSAQYNLSALLARFDSRFTAPANDSSGWGCQAVGVQGTDVAIRCWGGQDVPPAWVFVYDTSITPSPTANPIVAALDLVNKGSQYPNPVRWTVLHGAATATTGWIRITPNNSSDARFTTRLAQNIAANPTATDFYVTDDPGAGVFDQARPGDLANVGSGANGNFEVIRIESIPQANHWVVTRNYGTESTGVFAHNQNDVVAMRSTGSNLGVIAWDYVNDPHGLNANGKTVDTDDPYMQFGHGVWGPGETYVRIAEDSYCTANVGTSVCLQARTGGLPGALHQPASTYLIASPTFAGIRAPQYNTEYHPAMVQEAAYGPDLRWFLDSRPMIYGSVYGGTASKVSSTINLYKTTQTINPKRLPTIAACGTHPLMDISPGPITDGAGDMWKYCVGALCYAGARSAETYVNCPQRTYTAGCKGTNEDANGEPTEDVCIGDGAYALGSPVVQIDASRTDADGANQRVITYGFSRHRRQPETYWSNGKTTPDGTWALFATRWVDEQRGDLYAVKLPPWPPSDSLDRSGFIPIQFLLTQVPAGTDNVVAEFGYDSSLRCTSRPETCVSVTGGSGPQAINEATPFYWASETYSGIPCATGCSVTIPAISQRMVYYRMKYRSASGALLGISRTEVAPVP